MQVTQKHQIPPPPPFSPTTPTPIMYHPQLRPDITVMVDWALKTNNQPPTTPGTGRKNPKTKTANVSDHKFNAAAAARRLFKLT